MNEQATAVSIVLLQVEDRTTQAVLRALLKHTGLQEIDGVPIHRWIDLRRAEELERVMMALGDKNPEVYSGIATLLAELRKKAIF